MSNVHYVCLPNSLSLMNPAPATRMLAMIAIRKMIFPFFVRALVRWCLRILCGLLVEHFRRSSTILAKSSMRRISGLITSLLLEFPFFFVLPLFTNCESQWREFSLRRIFESCFKTKGIAVLLRRSKAARHFTECAHCAEWVLQSVSWHKLEDALQNVERCGLCSPHIGLIAALVMVPFWRCWLSGAKTEMILLKCI